MSIVHTDSIHGIVFSHWAVPWVLLLTALVVILYGRFEFLRVEGSALISMSSYMASAVLSIVSLCYVFMLPIRMVLRHTPWTWWDVADWSALTICAVVLTVISWMGIHKTSSEI